MSKIIIIFVVFSVKVGCSSASLSGSGGTTKPEKSAIAKQMDVSNKGDDASGEENTEIAKKPTKVKVENTNEVDTDIDPETEIGGGSGIGANRDPDAKVDNDKVKNDTDTFCVAKDSQVNIVYVIDNTSSMSKSEVGKVREGALALLGDISKVADSSATKYKLAVVGFGNGSAVMPNGWVQLGNPTSLIKLQGDVSKAADPNNRGGDSIPDIGLRDAAKLFTSLPSKASDKLHRNFVVLYTDYGIEDDSNERDLPIVANQLANSIGAAIIVVGLGDPDNESIWDSVSLPKTGIVSPRHVGRHIKTGSADALSALFKSVGTQIQADCQ